MAAVRSRQGLGTLRARTRPSVRRLFVAGKGWVPSRRALVHPDGGCFVASRAWVSPVPDRASPPLRTPFFLPSPWPVVCLFPGGGVCRRVRGVSSSRLSATAWSWWAALSGWASSGWVGWSFSVLLVGLVGFAHGVAMLGRVVRLGVGGAWLRGCVAVAPAFLPSAWVAGVRSWVGEGCSAVSYW